jgi:hypothetical protein
MQLSDKGTDAFQLFYKNKNYWWEITIQNTEKYRPKFVKQIYKLIQNFSILWETESTQQNEGYENSMNSEATNREKCILCKWLNFHKQQWSS